MKQIEAKQIWSEANIANYTKGIWIDTCVIHATCPSPCCMPMSMLYVWTQTNQSEYFEANWSKNFEAKWMNIEANILSFRFALCSKRIFWSELKQIEANISFFRFAFVSKRIKANWSNYFIRIFTNQSKYSPNKTSIRFDSLRFAS